MRKFRAAKDEKPINISSSIPIFVPPSVAAAAAAVAAASSSSSTSSSSISPTNNSGISAGCNSLHQNNNIIIPNSNSSSAFTIANGLATTNGALAMASSSSSSGSVQRTKIRTISSNAMKSGFADLSISAGEKTRIGDERRPHSPGIEQKRAKRNSPPAFINVAAQYNANATTAAIAAASSGTKSVSSSNRKSSAAAAASAASATSSSCGFRKKGSVAVSINPSFKNDHSVGKVNKSTMAMMDVNDGAAAAAASAASSNIHHNNNNTTATTTTNININMNNTHHHHSTAPTSTNPNHHYFPAASKLDAMDTESPNFQFNFLPNQLVEYMAAFYLGEEQKRHSPYGGEEIQDILLSDSMHTLTLDLENGGNNNNNNNNSSSSSNNNKPGSGGSPPDASSLQARIAVESCKPKPEQIEESCPICKESIDGASAITNLSCKHYFHTQCISAWLPIQSTCPVCRTIIPRFVPRPSVSTSHMSIMEATNHFASSPPQMLGTFFPQSLPRPLPRRDACGLDLVTSTNNSNNSNIDIMDTLSTSPVTTSATATASTPTTIASS